MDGVDGLGFRVDGLELCFIGVGFIIVIRVRLYLVNTRTKFVIPPN